MTVCTTADANVAERDHVAAVTASEWIAELLAEPSPEWHVVARLADELGKIAAGCGGAGTAG